MINLEHNRAPRTLRQRTGILHTGHQPCHEKKQIYDFLEFHPISFSVLHFNIGEPDDPPVDFDPGSKKSVTGSSRIFAVKYDQVPRALAVEVLLYRERGSVGSDRGFRILQQIDQVGLPTKFLRIGLAHHQFVRHRFPVKQAASIDFSVRNFTRPGSCLEMPRLVRSAFRK